MVMGRPTDISREEIHELGKEMVAFFKKRLKEGKPCIHFVEWYSLEKDMDWDRWDHIRQRDDFSHYMKQSREILSHSIVSNEKLAQSYGNRFLTLYSKDVRDAEVAFHKEKAMAEAEAKLPSDLLLTEKEERFNRAIVEGITALQQAKKSSL